MTNNLIIQTSNNALTLSNNQTKELAFAIVQDIADYIKNNQAAYHEWLKEQEETERVK